MKNYTPQNASLNLSKEELAQVLESHYSVYPITITNYRQEELKKGWGINSDLFLLTGIEYIERHGVIELPRKLVIKQYKENIRKIIGDKQSSLGRYKREKEIYDLSNRFIHDTSERGIKIPTFVTCHNSSSEFLDDKRILVLEYGGTETEEKILELGMEINNMENLIKDARIKKNEIPVDGEKIIVEIEKNRVTLEKRLMDLLGEGLKTTALFHTKMDIYEYKTPEDEKISMDMPRFGDYRSRLLAYIDTIFQEEIGELPRKQRSELKNLVEALAEYYSNKNGNNNNLITTIHGDLHNRNIILSDDGYTVFVDGGHIRRGPNAFDVAEQLINDVVYLPFGKLEQLIAGVYLREKATYEKKFGLTSSEINENSFIGAVMLSSLFKILKATAFTTKVKRDLPEHYSRLLIYEPQYRLRSFSREEEPFLKPKDVDYNLSAFENVVKYIIENNKRFDIQASTVKSIESLLKIINVLRKINKEKNKEDPNGKTEKFIRKGVAKIPSLILF